MKTLALINEDFKHMPNIELLGKLTITGLNINCALVDVQKPSFNAAHSKNEGYVLLRVKAFSCNYRDKGLILKAFQKMSLDMREQATPLSFFGSDFVAEVVSIGKNVTEFECGDRVIPDCSYPEMPAEGVPPGVVTNEASRGWLRIHKSRLTKIPRTMPDALAASFTIGAQTSNSMIRKVDIKQNDNVLITSGRSNTSIFIIRNLLAKGIIPDVLSTSEWTDDELAYIAPANIMKVSRASRNWNDVLKKKYDVVFDPFFDLHLYKVVDHLNSYARYITCGLKNQHENFKELTDTKSQNDLLGVMLKTMIGNVSIIGNCIGTKDDLQAGLKMLKQDLQPIPIWEELTPADGLRFLDLTYNLKRLGKVVMNYND